MNRLSQGTQAGVFFFVGEDGKSIVAGVVAFRELAVRTNNRRSVHQMHYASERREDWLLPSSRTVYRFIHRGSYSMADAGGVCPISGHESSNR